MHLSEHFTLEELTHSEAAVRHNLLNTPDEGALANLKRLAVFLEKVRATLGKPVLINSAYRSHPVNSWVGGKPTSQHCLGCAADIRVPDMPPNAVIKAIIASDLQYDQVIREFDSWTHISIPNNINSTPRKQALIIDSKGTRKY
jgi:zinc D-Ala-D-Ala carboxypeptidase